VWSAFRTFKRLATGVRRPPEQLRAAVKGLREAHAAAIAAVRQKEIMRQLRREEGHHPLLS
jgi:hypothetical protein